MPVLTRKVRSLQLATMGSKYYNKLTRSWGSRVFTNHNLTMSLPSTPDIGSDVINGVPLGGRVPKHLRSSLELKQEVANYNNCERENHIAHIAQNERHKINFQK